MRNRSLTLALLASLAAMPAFAQDESASPTAKRFSVTGGYALSEPKSDTGRIAGSESDFGGDGAPTLGATWHINDNFAVEAWGADAFGHRVELGGAKAASVKAQPYALSAQYHFGDAARTVRPFVGLGYYEMNFKDEQASAGGPLAGNRIGIDTAKGPMATLGVDFNITPTWFARTDVRYLHTGATDVRVNGVDAAEAKLDPVVVGVGIGARF